jgi:four helix bundle protein
MPTPSKQVREEQNGGPSARVQRFEDLIAWQKARVLVKDIYLCTRQGSFARDFALANQIQRAGVSILSNIAEGFERAHPREFHQALAMARASCAEVRSQLYVAFDVGYLDQNFDRLMSGATEVGRIIGGLRLAVARRLTVSSPRASRTAAASPA